MGTEVIPKLTFEQFRQLPSDGKRYELVHGEVHATPAPATRHQAVLQNLSGNLWTYVIKNHLGEVWTALAGASSGTFALLRPPFAEMSRCCRRT